MRIQHNISALNSYRQLGNNNNMLSKNLEKLSSGYRINRAGDDAAGLAISEKMRAQIKGLETAQKNANDGISLVQTAEGALTEVHSMLNRMTELATQSANGTYDDKVDRENLQKEVDALKEEIDRISKSTNFNGIDLLNGTYLGSTDPVTLKSGGAQTAGTTPVSSTLTSGLTNFVPAQKTAGTNATLSEDYFAIGDVTATTDAAGTGAGTTTVQLTFKDGAKVTATLTSVATGAGDANKAVTLSAADLVAALSGASGANNSQLTGTLNGADAANGTLKLDLTQGTKTKTWDDLVAQYTFAQAGGELSVKAKGTNTGPDFGAETLVVTPTNTTVDKTTTQIKDKTTGAVTTVNIGDRTQSAVDGLDKVDGSYVKSSMEFTVENNTIADAHGKTISLNGKTFILKEKFTELDADQKAQVTSGNATILEFTEKEANGTNIANDVKDERSVAGIIAKQLKTEIAGTALNGKVEVADITAGNKIILRETQDWADQVLTDTTSTKASVAEADFKTLVGSAVLNKVVGATTPDSQYLEVNGRMKNNSKVTIDGKTYEFLRNEESKTDANAISVTLAMKTVNGEAVVDDEGTARNLLAVLKATDPKFSGATILGGSPNTVDLGISVDSPNKVVVEKSDASGLLLQVGDTSDTFNKVGVVVEDMSTKSLGIADIDISTQDGASSAIKLIKEAINKVSSTRGDLGAVQNRLEHTINNLGVTTENITAAESRIRDTDMASEMMQYTKNNILIQASQAMLAQANQVPQGVLQLLQ